MPDAAEPETNGPVAVATRLIQVANISPHATRDQLYALLSYLGKLKDLKLYPVETNPQYNLHERKVCYAQFEDSSSVGIAQHLNGTVFIDRALVCVPVPDGVTPDEDAALKMGVPGQSGSRKLPATMTNQIQTVDNQQVIVTVDSTLASLGLPSYPPLPTNTDASKIEEIRRTIYVGNIPKEAESQELVDFVNEKIGEVMFFRWAGDESLPVRNAYIEFSQIASIASALQQNNVLEFKGSLLRFQHSTVAIHKPLINMKTHEAVEREIQEAMKKGSSSAASLLISKVADQAVKSSPVPGGGRSSHRSSRSRSRHRDRSRSRSRHRRKSRTRSRSRDKHRSRGSSRRRSRTRSPPRRKRSRTRSRSRAAVVPPTTKEPSGSRSRRKRSRTKSKSRERRRRSSRDRSPERKRGRRSRTKSKSREREKDRKRTDRDKDKDKKPKESERDRRKEKEIKRESPEKEKRKSGRGHEEKESGSGRRREKEPREDKRAKDEDRHRRSEAEADAIIAANVKIERRSRSASPKKRLDLGDAGGCEDNGTSPGHLRSVKGEPEERGPSPSAMDQLDQLAMKAEPESPRGTSRMDISSDLEEQQEPTVPSATNGDRETLAVKAEERPAEVPENEVPYGPMDVDETPPVAADRPLVDDKGEKIEMISTFEARETFSSESEEDEEKRMLERLKQKMLLKQRGEAAAPGSMGVGGEKEKRKHKERRSSGKKKKHKKEKKHKRSSKKDHKQKSPTPSDESSESSGAESD